MSRSALVVAALAIATYATFWFGLDGLVCTVGAAACGYVYGSGEADA